jgi:arylsulfatase A-like enzyme
LRVTTPVGLTDVAPTLLDLAGLAVPEGPSGRSLAPAILEGREPPQRPVHALGREAALRVGRFKLLRPRSPEARPPALYDLEADPAERDNLLETRDAVRRRLEAELARLEAAADGAAAGRLELSADDRSRLRALGYVVD